MASNTEWKDVPPHSPEAGARQRAEQAARELVNAANVMDFDAKIFAETIRRDHRTIQQTVGRVVFELINQWADDYESENYDLRNEDIVKAAHAVRGQVGIPGMRLI